MRAETGTGRQEEGLHTRRPSCPGKASPTPGGLWGLLWPWDAARALHLSGLSLVKTFLTGLFSHFKSEYGPRGSWI